MLRIQLTDIIEVNLSLKAVIKSILAKEKNWNAFCRFCEKVLIRKENEERKQERRVSIHMRRFRRRSDAIILPSVNGGRI